MMRFRMQLILIRKLMFHIVNIDQNAWATSGFYAIYRLPRDSTNPPEEPQPLSRNRILRPPCYCLTKAFNDFLNEATRRFTASVCLSVFHSTGPICIPARSREHVAVALANARGSRGWRLSTESSRETLKRRKRMVAHIPTGSSYRCKQAVGRRSWVVYICST